MDDILMMVKTEQCDVLELIEKLALRFDYQTGDMDVEAAAIRAADLVFDLAKAGAIKVAKNTGAVSVGTVEAVEEEGYGHPAYVN